MPTSSNDPLAQLQREIERIRRRLYAALDAAGGDHSDANVQAISRDFDKVLSDYMRTRNRHKGNPSPPSSCGDHGPV